MVVLLLLMRALCSQWSGRIENGHPHSSLGFLTPEEFMGIHSPSEENLAPKKISEVP